jgi:PKD repeat protein
MKTNIYKYLAASVVAVTMAFNTANAQMNCGTDEAMKQLFKDFPQLEEQHNQLWENAKKEWQQQKLMNPQSTAPLVVPIVFHIIHQYGSENISKAQIVDQVNILNMQYRKQNADTATVEPSMIPFIADSKIEFRLPTKDPDGNCTDGIDRIYSHKTNQAGDDSKLNQWPRDKYLNVWVVRTIASGAAGYAYYPSATTGIAFTRDGIIILHNYVGSIGTSQPSNQSALTHEIGHYLNLAHVWGSNNQAGAACGDDGIGDTPETKGFIGCPSTIAQKSACALLLTPPDTIIENYENYMDYSYCFKMFTIGQAFAMNSTLNSAVAYRNNLWTTANRLATGTDSASQANMPLCIPKAEFNMNRNMVCQGGTVTFTDRSWRGVPTSWQWIIPNGTPSTSTAQNPTITFNTWGQQDVTLIATNASGSDTMYWKNAVFVSQPWDDGNGTYSESFENNMNFENLWLKQNMEDNGVFWKKNTLAAYTGTTSVYLPLFNQIDQTGNGDRNLVDAIISPSLNLTGSSNMSINFKFSGATTSTNPADYTENLKVYVSNNCGQTWSTTPIRTLTGAQLLTGGYSQYPFYPNDQSLWGSTICNIPSSYLTTNFRFKIEYTSGNKSNNLYIDDINLSGTVGVNEIVNYNFGLNVFPNPANGNDNITISYTLSTQENITVSIVDMIGKEIAVLVNTTQTSGDKTINIRKSELNLTSGVYLVKISNSTSYTTRKLVVN